MKLFFSAGFFVLLAFLQALVIVITDGAADVLLLSFSSVPFCFACPVHLTGLAAVSEISESHI